jgi:Zn-dependent metalloprotease
MLVPPHVLREIIRRRRNDAEGVAALNTLAVRFKLPITSIDIADLGSSSQIHRVVYSAGNTEMIPGELSRSEGQGVVSDQATNEAYDGLGYVYDFYRSIYRRNSINDKGMPLVATVHFGEGYDDAFWHGNQIVFGDGDGIAFNRFTIGVDLIGHELTGGISRYEINFTYLGQSGALNESIANVFGSLIKQYVLKQTADQADWLIGEGLLTIQGQALRSLKAPGTAYDNTLIGRDPQPAHMQHYVRTQQDLGGVHINSGIPNHAFYLCAMAIGGHAWEKAGQIWYDTILDKSLRPTASFGAFAGRTVANAGRRYGANSIEQKAVIDSWERVGVQPR